MDEIFICTNEAQFIGAKISEYTFLKSCKNKVNIINEKDFYCYKRLYNKKYLRKGAVHKFCEKDLQSWTLLRFSPPEIMKYKGRAIVVDPDVFVVDADLNSLFNMVDTSAIACKKYAGHWASSVMVLNNEMLRGWKLEEIIENLINMNYDYRDLINLKYEKNIKILDDSWNKFDSLDNAKLLHTTNRITQPWRKGLKTNMVINKMKPMFGVVPRELIHFIFKWQRNKFHREHPDKNITEYFFKKLNSAYRDKHITEKDILLAIKNKHIRSDIWEIMEKYE